MHISFSCECELLKNEPKHIFICTPSMLYFLGEQEIFFKKASRKLYLMQCVLGLLYVG